MIENHASAKRPRFIAFYLPQFYPTPYNDEWWGKGFTEWTNVVQGRPHFEGHYQPHIPADLGFYDLRLPETREAQADLAREYGVYGFCYYHYWFNGTRILERPLDEVLATGKPDFPFCICWANENWCRSWKGQKDKILIAQNYSPEDDAAHIRQLLPTLSDSRYITVNGSPVILIYRTEILPNPRATAELWRNEAVKRGLPDLYLVSIESNYIADVTSPAEIGFDATLRFEPNFAIFSQSSPLRKSIGKTMRAKLPRLHQALKNIESSSDDTIYDYEQVYQNWKGYPSRKEPHFECVTPMWDNSARRFRGATIVNGSTPQLYERWLKDAVTRSAADETGQKTIFINAWNEWAEGCHLEPCMKWGRQYLEATQRAYFGK
jgi:lipopolysaccharide biosynthesis protein